MILEILRLQLDLGCLVSVDASHELPRLFTLWRNEQHQGHSGPLQVFQMSGYASTPIDTFHSDYKLAVAEANLVWIDEVLLANWRVYEAALKEKSEGSSRSRPERVQCKRCWPNRPHAKRSVAQRHSSATARQPCGARALMVKLAGGSGACTLCVPARCMRLFGDTVCGAHATRTESLSCDLLVRKVRRVGTLGRVFNGN